MSDLAAFSFYPTKVLGGFGLTEPGAGSDAGGTKTVAEDRGDHWVLNGSKIFITHAGVGEIFVVTARTDPGAKKTHGITSFIVSKDTTDLDETGRCDSTASRAILRARESFGNRGFWFGFHVRLSCSLAGDLVSSGLTVIVAIMAGSSGRGATAEAR